MLRKPLVFGVPTEAILFLAFMTGASILVLGPQSSYHAVSLTLIVVSYIGLRLTTQYLKSGWIETFLFRIELIVGKLSFATQKSGGKAPLVSSAIGNRPILMHAPETLDEDDLVEAKESLLDILKAGKQSLYFSQQSKADGVILNVTDSAVARQLGEFHHVYSLVRLPALTDPLWLYQQLASVTEFQIFVRVLPLKTDSIRRSIEVNRRNSAPTMSQLRDIDAKVSFEDTETVLEAISRGIENLYELSVVIASETELELNSQYWLKEKNLKLALSSVTGTRPRFHRSHVCRAVTVCDLIPNLGDPQTVVTLLTTLGGRSLSFDPMDSRLESLHWLVSGATGSGKSFFTALILDRLNRSRNDFSVLFVDHNYSFIQFLENRIDLRSGDNLGASRYFEPYSRGETETIVAQAITEISTPGKFTGIELSNLSSKDRPQSVRVLFEKIDTYLRSRTTNHTIYIVLDECWNFMRDDAVGVQRAFREYRKLGAAVIAITQSLRDLVSDEAGQSIFQNAPIRILLRQGEDVAGYQGMLGLNQTESQLLRRLKQARGEYSECLIKTPFLSRVARLYPTEAEYRLLRCDQNREYLFKRTKKVAI